MVLHPGVLSGDTVVLCRSPESSRTWWMTVRNITRMKWGSLIYQYERLYYHDISLLNLRLAAAALTNRRGYLDRAGAGLHATMRAVCGAPDSPGHQVGYQSRALWFKLQNSKALTHSW